MYDMQSISYTRKRRTLTQYHIYALSPRVGRKKQFEERITLPLSAEMLASIDSSLQEGEVRLDLIRAAIEREIKRRSKATKEAR